jgi:hypothetical protein
MAWHGEYVGDTAREMSTHLKAHANRLASEFGIEITAAEECLDLLLEVPSSRRSADSLPAFGDTPLCLLADLLRSFPANDVVDLMSALACPHGYFATAAGYTSILGACTTRAKQVRHSAETRFMGSLMDVNFRRINGRSRGMTIRWHYQGSTLGQGLSS